LLLVEWRPSDIEALSKLLLVLGMGNKELVGYLSGGTLNYLLRCYGLMADF